MYNTSRSRFSVTDLPARMTSDSPSTIDVAVRWQRHSRHLAEIDSKSKRSRFITLFQTATKSLTNFCCRVVTGINFREGAKLRVRTKHEIDSSASPFDLTRLAVPSFKDVLAFGGLLPLGAHVQQVHEEVIGQRLRSLVKTPSSDFPKFAFRTRMPPTSTVISGAVSVNSCTDPPAAPPPRRSCP